MKEVLIEGEGLKKQRGSVLIGRGDFSAIVTPLEDAPRSEASENIDYRTLHHIFKEVSLSTQNLCSELQNIKIHVKEDPLNTTSCRV